MNPNPDFRIDPVDWQKELPELKLVAVDGAALRAVEHNKVITAFCEIAIHAWRAERRMKDKLSGEIREEHKATYRSIAGIMSTLAGFGLELKDREGDAYDYGLPEKVVAAEKRVGLSRELVAETIRPSIFLHGQLAQPGEIVIAVPDTEPAEAKA